MTVFSEILARYGDDAVIVGADGARRAVKAFLQPVISRAQEKTPSKMTLLGETDIGRYYYFGPPDVPLDRETYIVSGDRKYDVVRAEVLRVERENSHWEAVLKRREEESDA